MNEDIETKVWAAVEALDQLHPLNAMSAMLLYFESEGIAVTCGIAADRSSTDWHIVLGRCGAQRFAGDKPCLKPLHHDGPHG